MEDGPDSIVTITSGAPEPWGERKFEKEFEGELDYYASGTRIIEKEEKKEIGVIYVEPDSDEYFEMQGSYDPVDCYSRIDMIFSNGSEKLHSTITTFINILVGGRILTYYEIGTTEDLC